MINKSLLGVGLLAALVAWTVSMAPVNAASADAHRASSSAACTVVDCPLGAPAADVDCGSTCPVAQPGDGEAANGGCGAGACPLPGNGDGEADGAGCGGGKCPLPGAGDD